MLIDVRRYSRQSQLLAAKAAERGMPITIVTDLYCDWAASYGDEVFAVPTDLNLFWDGASAVWRNRKYRKENRWLRVWNQMTAICFELRTRHVAST